MSDQQHDAHVRAYCRRVLDLVAGDPEFEMCPHHHWADLLAAQVTPRQLARRWAAEAIAQCAAGRFELFAGFAAAAAAIARAVQIGLALSDPAFVEATCRGWEGVAAGRVVPLEQVEPTVTVTMGSDLGQLSPRRQRALIEERLRNLRGDD